MDGLALLDTLTCGVEPQPGFVPRPGWNRNPGAREVAPTSPDAWTGLNRVTFKI